MQKNVKERSNVRIYFRNILKAIPYILLLWHFKIFEISDLMLLIEFVVNIYPL